MALHVLSLALVALRLVHEADVLHQGAVADGSLVQRRGAPVVVLAVDRTVVASGHKHVPLLGRAGRGGGFGDVREVRQSRDVVQQAARLRVWGIAVRVAVLLLDVPAELPALPLLQDLGLHLKKRTERKGKRMKLTKVLFRVVLISTQLLKMLKSVSAVTQSNTTSFIY